MNPEYSNNQDVDSRFSFENLKKKRMNELEFKTSRYMYVMDISNKLIDLDRSEKIRLFN